MWLYIQYGTSYNNRKLLVAPAAQIIVFLIGTWLFSKQLFRNHNFYFFSTIFNVWREVTKGEKNESLYSQFLWARYESDTRFLNS